MGNINVVIGSWGSYNECNERALGSDWLDLSDYDTYEEIEEELKKQGFELEGIDEELFIQDIEGIDDNYVNWDYVHPKNLFETLKESGILDDDYKYKTFEAFLEVESFSEFERNNVQQAVLFIAKIVLINNNNETTIKNILNQMFSLI